ncbi:MAG: cold shock domain-containing protein, partial [Bacteroidota bacterium]
VVPLTDKPATKNFKEKPAVPEEEFELEEPSEGEIGDRLESEIFSIKNGYGFIKYPPNNLFFHHTSLENADFSELYVDDHVAFTLAHSSRGQLIATDVRLLEEE